jgi:hypothetical protein
MSADVRQHTSEYVNIRQDKSAQVSIDFFRTARRRVPAGKHRWKYEA